MLDEKLMLDEKRTSPETLNYISCAKHFRKNYIATRIG
jgi:hypothetical protein